ncbi:(Fe-S)-binding protein [Methanocella conradii]|uniref:(Fe-S)-binding protein n=1 Tax=Methanocella conradii TaxID=1175444 RepID=UPI0020C704BD|nr:heterodisulfide reductase-related iron-sulfur binding cluster [Methanocella conradii]
MKALSENCIKCGVCEMVCPSALSSLKALDMDRSAKPPAEVTNCTTCNRCVAACPMGVPITKAIEGMRRSLSTPGYLETLHNISTYGLSVVPGIRLDVSPKRCKTAYFAGCLTNYRLRQIGEAVEYTLRFMGVEFTRIEEVCCGSPLNRIGRFDVAKGMLEKNLRQFRELGVETIITSCPGCTSTLLEYQDEFEVVHYLDMYDSLGIYNVLQKDEYRATLQYPCHLYRNVSPYMMRLAERILKRMCSYVPMEEPDRCCGAGGGVRRNDIGLARFLKQRKAADIRAVSPDVVAVVCPQCSVQLSEDFRAEDLSILVARNLMRGA